HASSVSEDPAALQRGAWALRRLSGGPGPETELGAFLGRQGGESLAERLEGFNAMIRSASDLHPIVRAAFGFHLWPLAGIGPAGETFEGAVVAARIAAEDVQGGLVFVPISMGGGTALQRSGMPEDRLSTWLDGMEQSVRAAGRLLDQLEAWQATAETATADLSGRTPGLLIEALRAWPYLSAPMAERLAGVSRAAVRRNLGEFERRGLVREVTGHGRFRMWTTA
ncbi:MAG: hypothetical protein AAGL98_03195, partial [Planctomycetota bacterium]